MCFTRKNIFRIILTGEMQLIYMGSLDDNDSMDYSDGWEQDFSDMLQSKFGQSPLERWSSLEKVYSEYAPNTEFLLIPEKGHNRKQLQEYSTRFLKKVIENNK